jgi:uncharacterized membrane protein YcaP (DUF421 family)
VFDMATEAWSVVVRALLVYAALFIGLRMMGKRELGQMTVFDLVVILLIANAVQNSMVGSDVSVQGGILAAFVLLVANHLVARLPLLGGWWGRIFEGTPTVLVQDGRFIDPHLRKEGVDRQEIEMAFREHGVQSVDEVKLAVLETDGAISIVLAQSSIIRTRRRSRYRRR